MFHHHDIIVGYLSSIHFGWWMDKKIARRYTYKAYIKDNYNEGGHFFSNADHQSYRKKPQKERRTKYNNTAQYPPHPRSNQSLHTHINYNQIVS